MTDVSLLRILSERLRLGEVPDTITEDQAAGRVREILRPLFSKMFCDEIEAAIASGKLRDHEFEFGLAWEILNKTNFPALRAWLENRSNRPDRGGRGLGDIPVYRHGLRSRAIPKVEMEELLDKAVIDAEQEAMNRALGVSREAFVKYVLAADGKETKIQEKEKRAMTELELLAELHKRLKLGEVPADLTEEAAAVKVAKILKQLREAIEEQEVADAIQAKKLLPSEISLARQMFAKHGAECFRAFVKARKEVVPPAASPAQSSKGASMDKVQADMNRKLMISPELFAKYNSPEPDTGREISEIQASINRQIGVSDALFAKWNGKP